MWITLFVSCHVAFTIHVYGNGMKLWICCVNVLLWPCVPHRGSKVLQAIIHGSNFASSVDDCCSLSVYLVLLNLAAVSWASKRAPTVGLSTMKDEYQSVALCTREIMWLWKLWPQLWNAVEGSTDIFGDSKACFALWASQQTTDIPNKFTPSITMLLRRYAMAISDTNVATQWTMCWTFSHRHCLVQHFYVTATTWVFANWAWKEKTKTEVKGGG